MKRIIGLIISFVLYAVIMALILTAYIFVIPILILTVFVALPIFIIKEAIGGKRTGTLT